MFSPLKRVLFGSPLASSQAKYERLTKVTGLAVLSSDALSSVAYATDAMLVVLVPAGLLAVGSMGPIALLIVTLLRNHSDLTTSTRSPWNRQGTPPW